MRQTLLLLLIIKVSISFGQSGSLDPTFGNGGKVITGIKNINDQATSIAVQQDGKIVVAGYAFMDVGYRDFAVARYNVNGSLDTTFDEDGKVTTSMGENYEYAEAMAIQPDGKIIVAGTVFETATQPRFGVARYNTNGSLDSTFDSDGKTVTPVVRLDYVTCLALQPNAKILVAGYTRVSQFDNDIAIVRYNLDGSLDTTFSGDGKVTTSIGTVDDLAYAIAIQTDQKIVVGGTSTDAAGSRFAFVRYNVDGSLDSSFGDNGKAVYQFENYKWSQVNSIAIQKDGKIVGAGPVSSGDYIYEFGTLRLLPDGKPNSTFDNDGFQKIKIGTIADWATCVAIQTDGKILVGGHTTKHSGEKGYMKDFALARLKADGGLDPSFDNDGIQTTVMGTRPDWANEDMAESMRIDGNRIYLAGSSRISSNRLIYAFAIAAYQMDGSIIPLKVLNFSATELSSGIKLQWVTANENNTHYYTIQRKSAIGNYEPIGTILAAGSGVLEKIYSYLDKVPLKQKSFYRLKMVNKDSTVTYSPVAIINLGYNKRVTVFPNPTKEFLSVTGLSIQQVEIINTAGQVIITKSFAGNTLSQINISHLTKGMYYVRIRDKDSTIQTQPLVIQ